jgi:hypothetical protein
VQLFKQIKITKMNQYNLKFKPGALKSLLEQASGGGAGGGMGAGKDTTGKKKKPYPLRRRDYQKMKQERDTSHELRAADTQGQGAF